MTNKYIFEFWHNGEAIEKKESNLPLIKPEIGQSIAILTWENENNSIGRNWWRIIEIKQAIWENGDKTILTQMLMIDIIPDPKNGLFKSNSDYESFQY